MVCLRSKLVLVLGVAVVAAVSSDAMEVEVTAEGEAVRVHGHGIASHAVPSTAASPAAPARPQQDGERGSSPPRASADVTSQATLAVFQKELEALETLVELQLRKMQMLEQMRAALMDPGPDAPAGEGEESLTGAQRPRTQQASQRELHEAVDRKLEAVAARVMSSHAETRFDSYFIEKALVDLDEDVVDVAMGKFKHLPTQDLVVLGARSGVVQVLLATGEELLRVDTKLASLTSVHLDTASDPPVLAAFSSGSEPRLRVFALDVRLDDAAASHDDTSSSAAPPLRPVSIQSLRAVELPTTIDPLLHGKLQAVAIARSTRRSMLSVAHEDGTLGFYALNGTLLHEVATHAKRVSTVATHRNVVALANGTSVAVLPMTRQRDPEFQVCHGSRAAVASIAFDPVFPDIVYTGTADGELLAFALIGGNGADTPRHCRLFHRSIVARTHPLHIAAMKGYVAAATQSELVLFNVTRVDGGAVTVARACSTQLASGRDVGSLTGRLAVSENGHATVLSVVTSSSAGVRSLLVLQSLLPSGDAFRGEPELWRGVMFMGMILLVVLSAQCFFRRQKESSGRFEDGDKWREILERHGRESSVGNTAAAAAAESRSRARDYLASKRAEPVDDTDSYMGDPTMYGATPDMFDTSGRRKRGTGDQIGEDEAELQRKIAEARRETLECSFDDVADDEY